MSDLMNVNHGEAWWHRVRLWLGLKSRSKRVRWADWGFHATVWIEIEDAYHCISRGTLAMSAMSAYVYIYIDSISIIFGVTMCDIPYLSSVSVSYFEGLPLGRRNSPVRRLMDIVGFQMRQHHHPAHIVGHLDTARTGWVSHMV